MILNQDLEDRNVLIKVNGISKANLAFQTEKKWSPHLLTHLKWVSFQDYDMEVCHHYMESLPETNITIQGDPKKYHIRILN